MPAACGWLPWGRCFGGGAEGGGAKAERASEDVGDEPVVGHPAPAPAGGGGAASNPAPPPATGAVPAGSWYPRLLELERAVARLEESRLMAAPPEEEAEGIPPDPEAPAANPRAAPLVVLQRRRQEGWRPNQSQAPVGAPGAEVQDGGPSPLERRRRARAVEKQSRKDVYRRSAGRSPRDASPPPTAVLDAREVAARHAAAVAAMRTRERRRREGAGRPGGGASEPPSPSKAAATPSPSPTKAAEVMALSPPPARRRAAATPPAVSPGQPLRRTRTATRDAPASPSPLPRSPTSPPVAYASVSLEELAETLDRAAPAGAVDAAVSAEDLVLCSVETLKAPSRDALPPAPYVPPTDEDEERIELALFTAIEAAVNDSEQAARDIAEAASARKRLDM